MAKYLACSASRQSVSLIQKVMFLGKLVIEGKRSIDLPTYRRISRRARYRIVQAQPRLKQE